MRGPILINVVVTCPGCHKTAAIEALHQPFEAVTADPDAVRRSYTYCDCPDCGREWFHSISVARGALPVA